MDRDDIELLRDIREEVRRCVDLMERGELPACEDVLDKLLGSLDKLIEGIKEGDDQTAEGSFSGASGERLLW